MPFDAIPEDRIPLGAARMIQLADYLSKLKTKQYNHHGWGYEDPECGTVACAMGWAGVSEMFGFKYEPANRDTQKGGEFFENGKITPLGGIIPLACRTFEISPDIAMYLFTERSILDELIPQNAPSYVDTRAKVIKALRAIAAQQIEKAKTHAV